MLSKVTGAELVLIVMNHMQSMVENGTWKKEGWLQDLIFLEKKHNGQRL
jgi:hypothetical protein